MLLCFVVVPDILGKSHRFDRLYVHDSRMCPSFGGAAGSSTPFSISLNDRQALTLKKKLQANDLWIDLNIPNPVITDAEKHMFGLRTS